MTNPAAYRTARMRGAVGLVAAALVAAATPAAAAPSLRDTLDFVGATLNRLCNDAGQSRFSRIDNTAQSRICYAIVEPGRLVMELRYRGDGASGGGYSREASGVLRQQLRFDKRSYFYCSSPDSRGYATLYMNCRGALSRSSVSCATVELIRLSASGQQRRESNRRSFANIIETRPSQCARLKGALNFVAGRSPSSRSDDPDAFFSK